MLGHALYLKAIHGGKKKNDRIDSEKLAYLLRGGNFAVAYAYPEGWRSTRNLLRRRTHYVRRRGQTMAHITNLHHQYNLAVGKSLQYASNRVGAVLAPGSSVIRKREREPLGLEMSSDLQLEKSSSSQHGRALSRPFPERLGALQK